MRKWVNKMNLLKEERIEMLAETLNKIKELSLIYKEGSPAWVLIQASFGHIKSVHYLESEANFDEETLGVRFNE